MSHVMDYTTKTAQELQLLLSVCLYLLPVEQQYVEGLL